MSTTSRASLRPTATSSTKTRSPSAAKTPAEQTALARQIAAADAHIDRLVYELYGLTEQEIQTVEIAT